MKDYFPSEGEIKEASLFFIFQHLYKNSISGVLQLESQGIERKLIIENQKIIFAYSCSLDDSLGNYLLNKEIIDNEIFQISSEYISTRNIRFGRALIELGYFDYDSLWKYVQQHLKHIVLSVFRLNSGNYKILNRQTPDIENILIDYPIPSAMVDGMRQFDSREFLKRKFQQIHNVYVYDREIIGKLDLKPYEMHVLQLVKRHSSVSKIINSSELLEFDTQRILLLLLILDAISTVEQAQEEVKPREEDQWDDMEDEVVNPTAFKSFEEAIYHYNAKYEIIYKTLSKEIGPIALSILGRSIENIIENLPPYLQKAKLNTDGTISEDLVLKSLWYHDFKKHIGKLTKGLEEILYAEIYTVKKHLGEESEQQLLKWMNRVGN